MISAVLPDINKFSTARPVLSGNAVIMANTTGNYFYPEHKTPFLFVANFINRGTYILNKKHIETGDRWFYFLNVNDELEIRFSTVRPLETVFILFSDNFIQDAWGYFKASPELLIDLPDNSWRYEPSFPNVPFELNNPIEQKITALQQKNLSKEDIDYLLLQLLTQFYHLAADTKTKINHINAVKKSTKEELYRRLFSARELMHDCVFENLSVDQIARQVCLNKFHFLACFKTLYKTTPWQYFRELKLQKAYQMLSRNLSSVTTVCHLLGFESVGSFSNLFKKRFGMSPSAVSASENSQF